MKEHGPWIEAKRYAVEDIANLFDVPAHVVTYDLTPGYWERQLARQIARRRIGTRLRQWRSRLMDRIFGTLRPRP